MENWFPHYPVTQPRRNTDMYLYQNPEESRLLLALLPRSSLSSVLSWQFVPVCSTLSMAAVNWQAFGWSLLILKNARASSTDKFLQNILRSTDNTPTGWVLSIINQVCAQSALTFFCDTMQKAVVVLLVVDLNKPQGVISSLIGTSQFSLS